MNVSPGAFHAYVAMLALSGVVILVVAFLPLGQQRVARLIGAVLGVAFLGYAYYLQFVFDGGTFELFYYVFALPFIYTWRVVNHYVQRRRAAERQESDARLASASASAMPAGPAEPPAPAM